MPACTVPVNVIVTMLQLASYKLFVSLTHTTASDQSTVRSWCPPIGQCASIASDTLVMPSEWKLYRE